MPIELGAVNKVGTMAAALRPVSDPHLTADPAVNQREQPIVQIDALASAHTPPINSDRVTEIRNAICRGQYPITPIKVSEALIAASMLLNVAK